MWRIFLVPSSGKDIKESRSGTIGPCVARQQCGRIGGWTVRGLLSYICLVLLMSCATKKIEIPVYEGVDPREFLAEKENIRSLESTFHIEFERDGNLMKGDAVLRLTPDSLDLQVYSLGFLVGEVTSNGTVMRSDPPLERNKLLILIDGIRNSFFWWSLKNAGIRDNHDTYRVSNSWRRLFLNKKTMMPEKQIIDLEGGKELVVNYEDPDLIDGIWFPSRMRIALSNQSVNLKIKTLSFNPGPDDAETKTPAESR
jgi:hypothetical protein